MKLERIADIRGHGVFRDFAWPQGLGSFKRWNVVYGWNGTGKTTLSNLLRLLQDRVDLKEGEARFDFGARAVKASAIQAEAKLLPQVKVFNRDAVSASIFENPSTGHLPPIFVVGADKVELQKEFAELQTKHPLTATAAVTAGKADDDALRALTKFATDKAKTIKDLLTTQGGEFNFFDATKFREEVGAIADPAEHLLEEVERGRLLQSRNAQPMGKLAEAHAVLPDAMEQVAALRRLLATTATSTVIEALAENAPLSSWVSTGLALHKHLDASSCLFCGQPLPSERVQQFEAHFNDRFKAFSDELAALEGRLAQAGQTMQLKNQPDDKLLYPELRAGYQDAVQACQTQIERGRQVFAALAAAAAVKRQRMFETLELDQALTLAAHLTAEQRKLCEELVQECGRGRQEANDWLGLPAVHQLNSFIRSHNNGTDQFADAAKETRRRLMRDAVAAAWPDWQRLSSDKADAAEKRRTTEGSRKSEADRIRELKAEIQQHGLLPVARTPC